MKKASEKASEGKHETNDIVKRLYRGALDTIKKLDELTKNRRSMADAFHPSVVALRIKLKDYCERLIFTEPVSYGRKAEELLWRKVFYEAIQLIKHNRRTEHTKLGSGLETAFRTHLVSATGYYHHLLLKLQLEFSVDLEGIIDIPVTQVPPTLKSVKSTQKKTYDSKVSEWAVHACHRCLTYLGDLARYQRDFDNVRNGFGLIAQRYYYQALVLCPNMGMPHNQLGTLTGSKNYSFEASYHYLRCIMAVESFEGAQGNLKRLFEKNRKRYAELTRTSPRNILLEQQRAKDIKRFLVRFVYLIDVFHTESCTLESKELQDICQNTLQDFNRCMFCQPLPVFQDSIEEKHRYLDDDLVFKVAAMSFLIIGKLQGIGSKQASAAIAFTLALFSQVLNHVVIRLQSALYEAKYPRSALDSGIDQLDIKEEQEDETFENKVEENNKETEPEPNNHNNQDANTKDSTELRRTKIQHLLRRRRRRRDSNSSEGSISGSSVTSDLSEGDLSEELLSESEDLTLYAESEIESNSDGEHTADGPSPKSENNSSTGVNGSIPQTESREVIDDNLKNMSSHFLSVGRKLPFDDEALKLKASPNLKNGESKELKNNLMNHLEEKLNQDLNSLGIESDIESESDSEADSVIDRAKEKEKTLSLTLNIMAKEGLLPTVKVFTDWLRCNPLIISTCAQGSQSLWSSLSVLLNFLPMETDINKYEICESEEVLSIVQKASKSMDWQQTRPLKEDVALQGIVSFRNIHKHIVFDIKRRVHLSNRQEALVRSCCLRNFGYYLTKLCIPNFSYNSERKLFIGSSQNVLSDQHAQQILVDSETRRNQLMRDMAQLRLQAEVSQLEGSLESSHQPSLSPYLVTDTGTLCNHLTIIKALVVSARFITIIPLTVIDQLDMLKKEMAGAREAIRYLESEFRKGNRYIRAQKHHERHSNTSRKTLKMKDKEAWVFFQMLDCCKYLAKQCADYEPINMVTLLTNYKLNSETEGNQRLQSGIVAAQAAGISVKNIVDFHAEWRDISKSQG